MNCNKRYVCTNLGLLQQGTNTFTRDGPSFMQFPIITFNDVHLPTKETNILSRVMDELAQAIKKTDIPFVQVVKEEQPDITVIHVVLSEKVSYKVRDYIRILTTTIIKKHNRAQTYAKVIHPRNNDNYSSIDYISSGGAASVEKVYRNDDPNTIYARKEFINKDKSKYDPSSKLFRNFLEETQNLLEHTFEGHHDKVHLVPIVDAYWTCRDENLVFRPRFFIVLQYYDETLGNLLRSIKRGEKRKSLRDMATIVLSLTRCVWVLHRSGHSAHSDIKPDNCAVREDLTVCLLDVGGLVPHGNRPRWTTERYCDPDITITGATSDTDKFALGLVMRDCIQVVCEQFPDEKIPKSLSEWTLKACHVGNRDRFKSPDEMYFALESILKSWDELIVDESNILFIDNLPEDTSVLISNQANNEGDEPMLALGRGDDSSWENIHTDEIMSSSNSQ